MAGIASTERVDAGQLPRPSGLAAGAACFVLLAGAAAADGAYFATSWSWIALLVFAGLAFAVLGDVPRPAKPALIAPASLLLLAGWQALATAGATRLLEPQRTLVYVAVTLAAALLLVGRRASALGGVVTGCGVVAVWALLTRLLPDRLGTFDDVAIYRLAEPVGYWNGLAILSVIGLVLALGFVDRSDRALGSVLAAASVPVFAATIYFTFGRAAWIALALAITLMLALDPHRRALSVRLLVLAPFGAAAVLLASQQDALTTVNSDLSDAARQGNRLLIWVLLLSAAAGGTAVVLGVARRRYVPGGKALRAYLAGLVALGVGLALLVTVRFGAPWTIAGNAYDSFTSPPPRVQDLNDRLFTFSANRRIELWDAAWENYRVHPLAGSGAGTFEVYWLQNRDSPMKVRDAHSLYLETLSELGPLGLALLLVALGVPVYAAFKARARPLVPAAFGAYVAYLLHAGVDWDWELPAVTLTALFVGASIVVAAQKPEDDRRAMSPRLRYGLLGGTLALGALAFVGLVGNMSLAQSADAARAGNWDESESKARRAATWAPWSPEPWQRIGEAQLAAGELGEARASFRAAIAKDERDWELWLDLARASAGGAQRRALAEATRLNPRSPEVAQLRKELGELGTIEVEG